MLFKGCTDRLLPRSYNDDQGRITVGIIPITVELLHFSSVIILMLLIIMTYVSILAKMFWNSIFTTIAVLIYPL